MKNQTLLMLIILVNAAMTTRRVILIHGIYSNCEMFDVITRVASFIDCVETGDFARSLASIDKQTQVACDKLNAQFRQRPQDFTDGIVLVGVSMGGMIAQRMLQKCIEVKPYIKRLFLLGTPTMGVVGLSDLYKTFGISLKYFQNLNGRQKDPRTPQSVHNKLLKVYERYTPFYQIKTASQYYTQNEDQQIRQAVEVLRNAQIQAVQNYPQDNIITESILQNMISNLIRYI